MLTFRRISDADDTSQFTCSSKTLTTYLKKYALDNDRRNISRCILALEPKKLVGYYTTSMKEVCKDDLERKDVRGLPGYPIPVVLIGKLAVHTECSGKGVGAEILKHIFKAVAKNVLTDLKKLGSS